MTVSDNNLYDSRLRRTAVGRRHRDYHVDDQRRLKRITIMEFMRFLVAFFVAAGCAAGPGLFYFVAQNFSTPMYWFPLTFIFGAWLITFITAMCAVVNFLDGP